MKERPDSGVDVDHAVFISGLGNIVGTEASSGFNNVLDVGTTGPVDVISEGDEGVGAEGDA